MNEKAPICSRCKKQCGEQINSDPTWFGKYSFDELVEVICIECWKNGKRWADSSLKDLRR